MMPNLWLVNPGATMSEARPESTYVLRQIVERLTAIEAQLTRLEAGVEACATQNQLAISLGDIRALLAHSTGESKALLLGKPGRAELWATLGVQVVCYAIVLTSLTWLLHR